MRKLLSLSIAFLMFCSIATAQIPYFGKAPGHNKLYGYTSIKSRPGINNIESYNTFQYGITDYAAGGIDFYTGPSGAYMGIMLRAGYKANRWFSIGCTATPSLNLNDSFNFSYFSCGLFMNGGLTKDSRLFWCTNTWFIVNVDTAYTINQYSYLAYEFALKNGDLFTPMLGLNHSWKFDTASDIAAGIYYTHNVYNFYVWGDDFFKDHPRVVIGVDFKF